jgi:hypothetical protein
MKWLGLLLIALLSPAFAQTSGSITGGPQFNVVSPTNGQCFAYNLATNTWVNTSLCNGSGGGSTPGGTNGQIQFNNSGALGGISTTGSGNVVLATSPAIASPIFNGNIAATDTVAAPSSYFSNYTWSGSGIAGASFIDFEKHACFPDTLDTVTSASSTATCVYFLDEPGTGATGARQTTDSQLFFANNVIGSTNTFYKAGGFEASSNGFTAGGTSVGPAGNLISYSYQTSVPVGSDYLTIAEGFEGTALIADTAHPPAYVNGAKISLGGVGLFSGNVLALTGTTGYALPTTALSFGSVEVNAAAACTSCTVVKFESLNNGAAYNYGTGFDLTNAVFANYALKSTGWSVDGSGNETALSSTVAGAPVLTTTNTATVSNKTVSCSANTLIGLETQCSSVDAGNTAFGGGMKCDGTTDDTAALNAAFNYVRASRTIGGLLVAKLVMPSGNCIISGSINATGITGFSPFEIDAYGTTLTANTGGTPVIDALGSRYVSINGLTIIGGTTSPPNIGLQIGRTNTTALNSADNWRLTNVTISGSFTFAALYNLNAETSVFDHLMAWNSYAGSYTACFSVVMDGLNHWNASSAFVTESQPTNTPQSFNEDVFINLDERATAGCTPLWLGNVNRLRAVSSYSANTSGSYGAFLYSFASTDGVFMADLDMHFESSNLTNEFLITGPNTTPGIAGFRYRDHEPFSSGAIFKKDTGITAVSMPDIDLDIGEFYQGSSSIQVFDTAANYTVNGRVYVPFTTNWTAPAQFGGQLCFSTACNGYMNPAGSTSNTGAGYTTFAHLTSGAIDDTAYGAGALNLATTAQFNSAYGNGALFGNFTGNNNSCFGYLCMQNYTGAQNSAFGEVAMEYVSTGSFSDAFGVGALQGVSGNLQTSGYDDAFGYQALNACQGANCYGNAAFGYEAGHVLNNGNNNTIFGAGACSTTLTSGSGNICIGANVDTIASGTSNEINIGGLLFWNRSSVSAPAVTACGTTPAIDAHANNRSGTVTVGTVAAASCTVTFAGGGYTTWNHCRVTSQTTLAAFAYSYTKTVLTVTGTSLVGDLFDYDCDGV